jgi:tetratricopeptide (TPR) repeat protein
LRLAEIALDRKDPASAIAAVQSIPDTDPLAHSARLVEADGWFQLNRLGPAEACWLRARKINPDHPSSWFWLMHLYAVQLRPAQWQEALWAVYDRGRAGMEEMLQLQAAGLELQNVSTNLARLRSAVMSDPSDIHSHRALGLHLIRFGKLQEARLTLEHLCGSRPEDTETAFALVECLIAAGDGPALRKLLERIPEDGQKDQRYGRALGALALLEDRPQDAIPLFRQALDATPFAMNLHVRLSEAYRKLSEYEGTRIHAQMTKETAKIEQLASMLHTNGWDLDLIIELSRACERLMLVEEARGWVQVGLSRASDDPRLLEARARLAAKPGTSSRKPPTWQSIAQSLGS